MEEPVKSFGILRIITRFWALVRFWAIQAFSLGSACALATRGAIFPTFHLMPNIGLLTYKGVTHPCQKLYSFSIAIVAPTTPAIVSHDPRGTARGHASAGA